LAEEESAVKSIIGGIVLVTLVGPAFAKEYWVEYNYSTHVCSIVEKQSPDTAQDNTAAETTNAAAPNGNTTSDVSQGTNAANTATEGAPVIVVPAPSDQATPGANAANTTTEGGASGAPNGAAASDATQGANAASATTEGRASGAPNAATGPDATKGASAANAAPKGAASGSPDVPTSWSVPTDAGSGGNVDPFKNLAEAWARKKAAAEAAGTDTTKALIGIAMHSRQEAEAEMQIMRKCGLKP